MQPPNRGLTLPGINRGMSMTCGEPPLYTSTPYVYTLREFFLGLWVIILEVSFVCSELSHIIKEVRAKGGVRFQGDNIRTFFFCSELEWKAHLEPLSANPLPLTPILVVGSGAFRRKGPE